MIEERCTEGVRRILDRSARLATDTGAVEIAPMHLLHALLREESCATEILAQHGLSCELFESTDLTSGTASADATATMANSVGPRPKTDSPRPGRVAASELFQQVISAAQQRAGLAGRYAEIGSELLLWGLAAVESPAAEILKRHGLDVQALQDEVDEKAGFRREPIDVDFSIRWQQRPMADQTDTYRILDASANRAREGLRVVEDFVRFTLDDAHLTGRLKSLRHELTGLLDVFGTTALLTCRDTTQDVGTGISTPAEAERPSAAAAVQANFKRVQEALRTLEEFAKVLRSSQDERPLNDAQSAERFGAMRYDLYTLEKAVLLTQSSRERLHGRDLYVLVTEEESHHGAGPAIREALAAGAGIVQVREKSMPDRKLVEHGQRVRQWTHDAGALFVMNDRPDLAVFTDADGVHVGQEELSVRQARRIVGPDRLVGVSTHTIEQARQAVLDGADYIGVGPVFSSVTKEFERLAGLDFVRQVAAEISLPWFAIGGITHTNIHEVQDAGATRVAVSSAVCGAEHPGRATQLLLDQLRQAGP